MYISPVTNAEIPGAGAGQATVTVSIIASAVSGFFNSKWSRQGLHSTLTQESKLFLDTAGQGALLQPDAPPPSALRGSCAA